MGQKAIELLNEFKPGKCKRPVIPEIGVPTATLSCSHTPRFRIRSLKASVALAAFSIRWSDARKNDAPPGAWHRSHTRVTSTSTHTLKNG